MAVFNVHLSYIPVNMPGSGLYEGVLCCLRNADLTMACRFCIKDMSASLLQLLVSVVLVLVVVLIIIAGGILLRLEMMI